MRCWDMCKHLSMKIKSMSSIIYVCSLHIVVINIMQLVQIKGKLLLKIW